VFFWMAPMGLVMFRRRLGRWLVALFAAGGRLAHRPA
jgi:hypothetical protein